MSINSCTLLIATLLFACLFGSGACGVLGSEGKTCCLPQIHSYKATYFRKEYQTEPPQPPQPGNGTTKAEPQPDRIIVEYNLDLVNFRRRELTIVQINETELVFNTIRFKNQQDSLTYEYRIKQDKCTCSKWKTHSWRNTCVTSNDESIIYHLGNNLASITMIDLYGGKVQYTTLSEPLNRDTCWITSKTMFFADNVQDYKYFDMSEKVDDNDFEIPMNCPPMDACN